MLIGGQSTLNQRGFNVESMLCILRDYIKIASFCPVFTCSQNRQSTKFQNHENINFVEKLYFFILYNHVYIAKHDVKSLHPGFIFRENTSHYKVGG